MSPEKNKEDEVREPKTGDSCAPFLSTDSFIFHDLIMKSINDRGLTDPNRLERITVTPSLNLL